MLFLKTQAREVNYSDTPLLYSFLRTQMTDTQQQAIINKNTLLHPAQLSRFSIPENVLSQELNGEVVLLNMESESYYSLNPVGSRMWQLLTEHGDMEIATQQLLQIYAVDEAMLRQDMAVLFGELVEEGLLIGGDKGKR